MSELRINLYEIIEDGRQRIHSIMWNIKTMRDNHRYGSLIKWIFTTTVVMFFSIVGVLEAKNAKVDMQKSIADEIIRFHVIANSDTEEDQAVKMKVKDSVINALRPRMSQSLDINVARQDLINNMDYISLVARQTLKENGYDYEVEVSLKMEQFPIKVYGDVTLPAGEYEALCIRLGKAEGHNWWCIVFPTLCYVDETYSYVPDESKDRLQYVLTEEEYKAVTQNEKQEEESKKVGEDKEIKVKAKFKLWDYLEKYFN